MGAVSMNSLPRLAAAAALLLTALEPMAAQDITIADPVWDSRDPVPDQLPKANRTLQLDYPDEMRKSAEIGLAVVSFKVDESGQFGWSVSASHIPFQQAVQNAVTSQQRKWKFSPGLKQGKAVPSHVWVGIIFNPKSAAPNTDNATPRLLAAIPAFTRERPRVPTGAPPDVTVKLELDATGKITNWIPEGRITSGLADALETALSGWRFAPARSQGKPTRAELLVHVLCMSPASAPSRFAASSQSNPPQVIEQEPPEYPYAMRRFGLVGEVQLDFEVGIDGHVQNMVIHSSTNPEFDRPALEALKHWKFSPGTKDGKPVVTHMRVPVVFTLDDSTREKFTIEQGNKRSLPPEMRYDTPAKIKNVQIPVYPYPLLRDRVTGKAEVVMYIDTSGRVAKVQIVTQEREEFGLALAAAAEGYQFAPALKDGLPVPFALRLNQSFSRFDLPDSSGDDLLNLERKNPGRIVSAKELDAPLKPLSRQPPKFPITLDPAIHEGDAVIECIVDDEGHARLPRVVSASAPAFGFAAAQATNSWWFEVPTRQGKPVAVRVRIPFKFSQPGANRRPVVMPSSSPAGT